MAKRLLEFAQRFGVEDGEGVAVNHQLTQEEIAQLVGACRETTNKALGDFANRGWIELSGKTVRIKDIERLRQRAR